MRKSAKFLFVFLLGGLLLTACSNDEATDTEVLEETTTIYEYDATTSKVEFTAYKFLTEKTGVGGAFDDLVVSGAEANEDPLALLSGLSIEIPITGLNTQDPSRDGKIAEFFFAEVNTESIYAKMEALDESNGTAMISVTMNDITNSVEGEFTLSDEGEFEFNAVIDVLDWEADAGIEALNEECHDLHVGNGDTESKLWPDVSISFTTKLSKVEN